MVCKGTSFCSFGSASFDLSESVENQHFDTPSSRFTFSAKEKDTETGFSYFGSRYYSSDLSIWLSVDPQASKYPSLSPYAYCANNPIKLVDPKGEDYEVVVDEKAKTITIRADFYALNSEYPILKEGLQQWNDKSGDYSYTVGDGADAKTYQVFFELNAVSCNSTEEVKSKSEQNACGNQFMIVDFIADGQSSYRGKYDNGAIEVSSAFSADDLFRAASHEPGHAIGIGDQRDGGLMESGGNSLDVKANYIASSLKYAGFNCQGPQDITFPTSPCKVSVRGNTPKGLGVVTKRK